ncbi:FtsK/SpoIIIE domain-containing protein [Cellulomonas sp. URHB0016]
MRLTALHPDPRRGPGLVSTVVEVERGLRASRLRGELARLTGWAGWSSGAVRLAVDDAVLDDTHEVGAYPLVPGCRLRPGAGPRPEAERALDSALHVAVVAGPDCGRLHRVRPDGDVIVRTTGATDPTRPTGREHLAVADPDLGSVRVRCSNGRVRVQADSRAVLVRAAPAWWRRRAGRPLTVRRRAWRRWRSDDELHVGGTTLVLRSRSSSAPSPPARTDGRPAVGRPGRGATWLTVLAPVAGSVVLAAVLRQPLLLLTAVSGPLALLATNRATSLEGPAQAPSQDEVRDPAGLVAATVLALDGGPVLHRAAPWDSDGTLAVVGPRSTALAAARAILLGELGTHVRVSVTVHTHAPDAWSWAAPAAHAADGPLTGDEENVVVVDLPRVTGGVTSLRSDAGLGGRLLLVLPSRSEVPAWCRNVLEVAPTTARLRGGPTTRSGARPPGRVRSGRGHGGWRRVPLEAVSTDTARAQLTRAWGVRELRAQTLEPTAGSSGRPADDLPARVSLGALPDVPAPDAQAIRAAWSSTHAGLAAPIGRTSGLATVVVDLVADGPHALVAGTTGAGKSELLTTWVLSTALRYPPERLAVLLVDFKGGAGLGSVAGLPHVVDHVTDLDEPRARRVLTGLRAELRRRERVLADHGARDVAELDPRDPASPPRLLVVVDELRALVDDLPDATRTLVRLAAQGRALGVHLVLATQRPAGAVSADLRANTSLRIALRVADPADSLDVVEVPDAALLSPSTPGRAVLRRAGGSPEHLQVARPGGRATLDGAALARPWPSPPAVARLRACDALRRRARPAESCLRSTWPRHGGRTGLDAGVPGAHLRGPHRCLGHRRAARCRRTSGTAGAMAACPSRRAHGR